MAQLGLFGGSDKTPRALAAGAWLLPGFALAWEAQLLVDIAHIQALAPPRQMLTPGGRQMSVRMTNAGAFGWVTDARGYRYQATDPVSQKAWPPLTSTLTRLATEAAAAAEYPHFEPDACLVNEYLPGAQMTLHQDKNERDERWPIVSVSLGLDATFLFGGLSRTDRPQRIGLQHGDVVVWGGPSRLHFHGIAPLKAGTHATLGARRINLTFRRAR